MKYGLVLAMFLLAGCSQLETRQAAVVVDSTIATMAAVNDKTTEVAEAAICAMPLSSFKRMYVSTPGRVAGLLAFCEFPSYLLEWIVHESEFDVTRSR